MVHKDKCLQQDDSGAVAAMHACVLWACCSCPQLLAAGVLRGPLAAAAVAPTAGGHWAPAKLLLCTVYAAATAPWPGGQRCPSMPDLIPAFCHKNLPVAGPAAALSCPAVLQRRCACPPSGGRQQGPRGLLMLLAVFFVTQHPQSRPGGLAAWVYLLPHPQQKQKHYEPQLAHLHLRKSLSVFWSSHSGKEGVLGGVYVACMGRIRRSDSCSVCVAVWNCVSGACFFRRLQYAVVALYPVGVF